MTRAILIIAFACALLAAPALGEEKDPGFKFKTDPKISQARPKKPMKIDVKRHEDGTYTWEISGGSVEEVLKADEELKRKLGVK